MGLHLHPFSWSFIRMQGPLDLSHEGRLGHVKNIHQLWQEAQMSCWISCDHNPKCIPHRWGMAWPCSPLLQRPICSAHHHKISKALDGYGLERVCITHWPQRFGRFCRALFFFGVERGQDISRLPSIWSVCGKDRKVSSLKVVWGVLSSFTNDLPMGTCSNCQSSNEQNAIQGLGDDIISFYFVLVVHY